jgi:hypothetical protein
VGRAFSGFCEEIKTRHIRHSQIAQNKVEGVLLEELSNATRPPGAVTTSNPLLDRKPLSVANRDSSSSTTKTCDLVSGMMQNPRAGEASLATLDEANAEVNTASGRTLFSS